MSSPRPLARCLVAVALFGSLSVAHAQTDDSSVYLEEDGFVVFEIEEHSTVEGWTLKADDNGYTGAGYLEWTGPNYYADSNAGRGLLSYRFRIQTPGNYELRIRNRINQGDLNTEHNDSWVQFPTGVDVPEQHPLDGWTKSYTNQADGWSWQTKTKDHAGLPIRQYFDEGEHVVEFSGRSAGHAIDRVVLYHYDEENFQSNRMINAAVSATDQNGSDDEGDADSDNGDGENEGGEGSDGSTDGETDETSQPALDENNINAASLPAEGETVTGECVDETLILPPEGEAIAIGNSYTLADALRLDPVGSRLLLKFDMRAVAGARTAQWQYSIADDDGNGEFAIWLASHSLWPDSPIAAPDDGVQMATASGFWLSSTRYATTLDASLLPSAVFSLAVDLDASGNDVTVATRSHEELAGSRLVLTGDAGFCVQYEQALAELAAQENEENTDGEDTTGEENENENTDDETDSGEDIDSGDNTGDDNDDSGNPTTGVNGSNDEDEDNNDRSSGDTPENSSNSSSGAAGVPALLTLLTLLGLRRRYIGSERMFINSRTQ